MAKKKVDKREKRKATGNQRIKELEEELKKTKYNKRTQMHIGMVKAQIAKLREKEQLRSAKKGKKEGFAVRKTGDASVVLLGFPSVGKSTLLNQITNAKSRIGHFDFTTLTVIPGLLEYNHAKIQILDVPGIVHGAATGKGRGKEILSMVRSADLILVLIDALHPEHHKAIIKEIRNAGIRPNEIKPVVKIVKKSKGGISIAKTVKLKNLDNKTIAAVFKEFKLNNVDVVIRDEINIDQLIDSIEANKVYMPMITILNKIDLVKKEKLEELKKKLRPDVLISAEKGIHIEEVKEAIFRGLKFMRIFLKEVGKKADLDEPMIVQEGCTIKDLCGKIHRDFINKFRFAKVWGKSAKFPGQTFFKLDKELLDGDIVEIHLR